MPDTIYVTTSIPYVNAPPHIGHALELVQADAIARYSRLLGHRVILQTGTDENARKNVLAAHEAGLPVGELVTRNADRFLELTQVLGIGVDSFIRTTEERHRHGVQEIWKRLRPHDLYRRPYEGRYCVGCEDFLAEGDLVDGLCPDHLTAPQTVSETNYFFRLSDYQTRVESLLDGGAVQVIPEARRAEVLCFVRSGLRDISVSRDSQRMSGWGITVPGDPTQTIYVWIDALMNYLTGIHHSGDGWRDSIWNETTRKIHVIGKNVWKFHAVYWPALLLSAGLPTPNQILVHGFLTVNGRKISKTLGNAVDPFSAAARRGAESLRHYLLAASPFADGDYSETAHDRIHEARLSNGLGNLVTRLTALCAMAGLRHVPDVAFCEPPPGYHECMRVYRLDRALAALWNEIAGMNREMEEQRPWVNAETCRPAVARWAERLLGLSRWMSPFLPVTCDRITRALTEAPIRKCEALFPRRAATGPRVDAGR